MSGRGDEMQGRAKEAIGDLTGDHRMKNEGRVDRASGSAKGVIDRLKNRLGSLVGRRSH